MRRRPERQFYFRLAAHLGGMTVKEMLARIDSREITEWMVYEKIAGPLGGKRVDVGAAIVAATVANTNRRKGTKAANPDDFVPKWDDYQSDEDMWAQIREANAAMGGEVAEPE